MNGTGVLNNITSLSGDGSSTFCGIRISKGVVCWGAGQEGQLGNGSDDSRATPVAVEGIGGSGTLGGVRSLVGELGCSAPCWCRAALIAGAGFRRAARRWLLLESLDTSTSERSGGLGNAGRGRGHHDGRRDGLRDDDLERSGLLGLRKIRSDRIGQRRQYRLAKCSQGGRWFRSTQRSSQRSDDRKLHVLCDAELWRRGLWGCGSNGQLGNGAAENADLPVSVEGVGGSGLLHNVTKISGHFLSFCAQLASGGLDCWGLSTFGQLGDGTYSESETPVVVKGLSGIGTLTGVLGVSGGNTLCAVLTSGKVDCWGYGKFGQLGDGDTKKSATPVAVKGVGGIGALSGVSSVGGTGTLCAILASGNVACWGEPLLGNGSTSRSSTPVEVDSIGN